MRKTMSNFRLLLLLFAAGFLYTGYVSAEEAGGEDFVIGKVAVVDVRKIMSESEDWGRFQEEHRQRRQEAEEIISGYESRLSILEMEYEDLPPGTDRAAEKRREFEELLQEYERREQELSQQFQRKAVEGYSAFYEKLGEAISSYAGEKGIDLVLKKEHLDFSFSEVQELEIFQAADVLFADPRLDISAEIIELLNK